MKYLIYLAIIAFVFWKAKPYILGWLIERKNRNRKIETVDQELVYTPVTSSRTFYFAIEIKEVGGGQAVVTVVKNKNLQG
jgi:hypothetical protein